MIRTVQLYTWYTTPSGNRQFCVVDKTGKHFEEPAAGGTKQVYRTTNIKLLETMNPAPINYDADKFWDLVDTGKLVEYIPGEVDPPEVASELTTAMLTASSSDLLFEAA